MAASSQVGFVLFVHLHTVAGITQESWQLVTLVGQWLLSQAMPFIAGSHKSNPQLENSGWVRAFVVIDFIMVSRDFAGFCQATTQIFEHVASRRPVKLVVSTNGWDTFWAGRQAATDQGTIGTQSDVGRGHEWRSPNADRPSG